LKIDKYINAVARRLDNITANGNDNGGNGHDDDIIIRDDEYYLSNHDRGMLLYDIPPRFYYYRHIREKLNRQDSITQDEISYALKRYLRMTPEQRYQREKSHYYFHELYVEGGRECNPALGGCTPKCRFYNEYGRIEDEEVIEMYIQLEESHRKTNEIIDIEPPDYDTLKEFYNNHMKL
jgi:hypothetical protein